MIKALKDYKELCIGPSWEWTKKHWKGYCLFVVLLYGLCAISMYWSNIKKFFTERFCKNEKNEEES